MKTAKQREGAKKTPSKSNNVLAMFTLAHTTHTHSLIENQMHLTFPWNVNALTAKQIIYYVNTNIEWELGKYLEIRYVRLLWDYVCRSLFTSTHSGCCWALGVPFPFCVWYKRIYMHLLFTHVDRCFILCRDMERKTEIVYPLEMAYSFHK